MSRFHVATGAAALCVIAAALTLGGGARVWAIGTALAAYAVVFSLGVAFPRMNFFCRAIRLGSPGGMRVALTFDDGPDPRVTPVILDILKERGARATFFCVGMPALAHCEIVKRIAREGHTLGSHTMRHAWWTNFLFGRMLLREIGRAQTAVARSSGRPPMYFRPPMGLTNPHMPGALRRLGMVMVGWDARSFDRGGDAEKIIARVVKKARDGSIILLHDAGVRPETAASAVAGIIDALRAKGYTFASLDELLVDGDRQGEGR